MKHDKILITGSIGSGKTTLANKLSKILKIKTYELDNIKYQRRDIHVKQKLKIINKKVSSIIKKKKWIVEGFDPSSWAYPIYRKAEIVIILNIKLSTTKKRIIIRFIKRKLSLKKDKKTNKQIKRTLSLLEFSNEYPKKYFKMQKDAAKKNNKKPLILNNSGEIKEFLKLVK